MARMTGQVGDGLGKRPPMHSSAISPLSSLKVSSLGMGPLVNQYLALLSIPFFP